MTRARDVANLIGSGNYSSTTFTATAGQTAFTISHTQGFIQVFMNGLLLDETADYTSNGSAVTLTSGAAAGDEIEVVAYNTFSVGDALNQAAADTRYVNTAGDTMSGTLNVNGGNFYLAEDNAAAHRYMFLNVGASHDGHIVLRRGLANKYQITAKTDNSYSIYGYPASGEVFNINSSGHVTKPKQSAFVLQGNYNGWTTINQSGQWLTLTGSTGVATSTNYEVAMAWVSNRSGGYNPTSNGINTSTGVFTAPVTGTYMFAFQTYVLKQVSSTEYYHINSFINGSNQMDYTIYGYNMSSNTYSTPEITKVVRLSANDTFAFRLYSNQNAAFKILPHYTCFTGHLLG